MTEFEVRFYAELNDFLPLSSRQISFALAVPAHTTIKHAIESLGVPHTEVDLILVNGSAVDFHYLPAEGDRVSIYPVFESIDISPLILLRPAPLRHLRFVLDSHLGKLARYLRLLGFDTSYRNDFSDAELASLSGEETRVLLTRDRGLLKRSQVTRGYYVRQTDSREQLLEIILRFDLVPLIQPFRRCLDCNQLLEQAEKTALTPTLLPNTIRYYDEFMRCPVCEKVYWKGSHYQHMTAFVDEILSEVSQRQIQRNPESIERT